MWSENRSDAGTGHGGYVDENEGLMWKRVIAED